MHDYYIPVSKLNLTARIPDFVACEKQRCRPACASAQSDQHHCFSLFGKCNILTYFRQEFNILAVFVAEQIGLGLSETL